MCPSELTPATYHQGLQQSQPLTPRRSWAAQAAGLAWHTAPKLLFCNRTAKGELSSGLRMALNTAWLACGAHVEAGRGEQTPRFIYDSPVTHGKARIRLPANWRGSPNAPACCVH